MGGIKHGQNKRGARSAEYAAWAHMTQRCQNEKHERFYQYGGRGIVVCNRWQKFENFIVDMGKRPSSRHSLDRINNDGNYEPSNCRWATASQQGANKRARVALMVKGESKSLAQWSRVSGLSEGVISYRVNKLKWSPELAVSTPLLRSRS